MADELYEQAVTTIRETQNASVDCLRGAFGIGYSRATSLMDALEFHGVVGPSNGRKRRAILEPNKVGD